MSGVKPRTVVIGFLLLAVLGVGYLALRPKQERVREPAQTSTTTTPVDTTTTQPKAQPGSYIDYSADIISKTSGTKLLFFHAPWCPQCRALEASIKSTTLPENVTIIKVDYDTNQALRKKYGVTIQTSLVRVDDSGNLVKKYVAYDEPTFAAVKQNLL